MLAFKQKGTSNLFKLLHIQNPKSPTGGATPSVEPTLWFQPLIWKRRRVLWSDLVEDASRLPVPLAESLARELMEETNVKTGPQVGTTTPGTTLPGSKLEAQ